MESYYEKLENFCNLLQLSEEDALNIFISHFKPNIYKLVRFFYLKIFTHTLKLAKQLESLFFNLPQQPSTPYKEPNNIYPTIQTIIKLPSKQFLLPSLLPKAVNPSISLMSSSLTFFQTHP